MRGGIRITERKIQDMIDEGRGCGVLADYKPWTLNRELPGRSPKIDFQQETSRGWTTGRSHQLQNRSQEAYFLLLEWSNSVTDIREHYPLHTFRECMRIADRIGVKYPVDSVTGHPLVLTETFLLDVLTETGPKLAARTVIRKTVNQLPLNELALLRICQWYWRECDTDWGYVDTQTLNLKKNKIYNIQMFYPHHGLHRLQSFNSAQIEWIAYELTLRVLKSSSPLRLIATLCDHDLNFPTGTSMNVARHLLANQRWLINMDIRFDNNKPLILLNAAHLA